MPATGKESLIIALDVPTVGEAMKIVETLDNVVFFKIGLQLFLTGELPVLLHALRQKAVFVDLKVPGDISNTIGSVIDLCVSMQVRFLTLSESMPISAISAAKEARDRKNSQIPAFLTVPFLSSLDRSDLQMIAGTDDVPAFILRRAKTALEAGCDGVVASGQEIRMCRNAFPDTIIVSPGIRPRGTQSDDHKRFTTPREAVLLGADYLVVGRPILRSESPREMAKAIIAEIDEAITEKTGSHGSAASPSSRYFARSVTSANPLLALKS